MDLHIALRVFREAAEQDSFAEAGRRIGLSPAAVSKNIAELEVHLGTRLFHRTTRSKTLTEEGRIYLEHVARSLDALADADEALGLARADPGGVLRVSAPVTVTMTWLSTRIPDFLARHPGLHLDLRLDDRRVDLVREGYDLAIRGSDHLEDTSLVARRLAEMPHVLCAAPAYLRSRGAPASPAALKTHECVRFSLSGHADTWTFRRDGRIERVTVQSRYSVSSSLAVCDALRAGFGLSLVPRPYVERDLREGRLQAVLEDWSTVTTTLYAVYPSRRHLAPKIRAFLEFLAETFEATKI